jgi:hypothetical protein
MEAIAAERIGQQIVDHPMAGDPALARKGLRYDIDPEMGFPTFPRAGMSGMKMRFVVDPEFGGAKLPGHDFRDPIF